MLQLAAPKQVVEGHYVANLGGKASKKVKHPRQQQPGGKRGPKPNKFLSNLSATAAQAENAASIYAEEEIRQIQGGRGSDDEDIEGGDDDMAGPMEEQTVARLPSNFSIVATELFFLFWNMEFDDKDVNFAFFAKITARNCKEYNLTAFAEESSCLAVIKERLEADYYISVDDFHYDFVKLFDNILTYYPVGHVAHTTAKELSATFDAKWKLALPQFVY